MVFNKFFMQLKKVNTSFVNFKNNEIFVKKVICNKNHGKHLRGTRLSALIENHSRGRI
jgi:hypothetical protein